MPYVKRADAVEIYWEESGDGPLVVLASPFFGYPAVFQGLTDDLVRDHRVVIYDIRGAGRSTKKGPYDIETDAEDLEALLVELGGGAIVLGMGDGANRSVKAAADRPDLVSAVVTPGGNPVGRQAAEGSEALVDSPAVLEALIGMMDTDYRAGLRTMVSSSNPQMDEDQARERVDRVVAYCAQEVGAPRLRTWIDDHALAVSRATGDRLWILEPETSNPWFAADAMIRTRKLLPDANIERIEDGVLSRPDLTALIVRRISGVSDAAVETKRAAL
jgi:pimeloyl-ACP methyl ester carboxylesterase